MHPAVGMFYEGVQEDAGHYVNYLRERDGGVYSDSHYVYIKFAIRWGADQFQVAVDREFEQRKKERNNDNA